MKEFPGSEYAVGLVFLVAVLATMAGALLAALTTRIIRGVCGLALCCFGLAGLYYFLHAPFLSLMEILIYVGAICVTIVFAVMLAEPDEAPARESRRAALGWGALALAISGAVFWGVAQLGLNHAWPTPSAHANTGVLAGMGSAPATGAPVAAPGNQLWTTNAGLSGATNPAPVAGALPMPTRSNAGSVQEIGKALLTTYSFAFELISLVLFVAILGALVIARYGRTKP